jgi:hypothetical protein
MLEMLIKGFLLGVATGPACMVTCFPVLLPVIIGGGDTGSPFSPSPRTVYSWRTMGQFLSGRAAAYSILGMLIGFLGSRMGGFGFTLAVFASFCMSLVMIAYGLGAPIKHFRPCHHYVRWAGKPQLPFVLGILTGFNVCPPFLLAMTICFAEGQSFVSGAVFFLAFFAASSLYMLPAGVGRVLSYFGPKATQTARVAAIFVGLFFFVNAGLHLWQLFTGPDGAHGPF